MLSSRSFFSNSLQSNYNSAIEAKKLPRDPTTKMGLTGLHDSLDDIFSLWTINRVEISQFIEQANSHHPTIKFTAEVHLI